MSSSLSASSACRAPVADALAARSILEPLPDPGARAPGRARRP